MVFETLGLSLYDIIRQNDYKRLPLTIVREVSRQLLESLVFMKSMNLIHTGTFYNYLLLLLLLLLLLV